MKPILIVEDEHALAAALSVVCRRLGRMAHVSASGTAAWTELESTEFAAVLLDIGLPDMSGMELLSRLRERWPTVPVVVLTAHGTFDNAVLSRRHGVAAYLLKPLSLDEVQETLKQVVAEPDSAGSGTSVSLLVGASPPMQRVFVEIAQACASDAAVLLSGATGTGKTLAARLIHENSGRRSGTFVTLHCGALPESLLESELFGHERHAFTGAHAARPGHLERAHRGTLFLDEIGDISLAVQAKLLRFVEDRMFSRIGGREDLSVDVRLITATHKNLREEVRAGRFREDLYYRLHVLEIGMPSLSERKGDIPALAHFFLGNLAPERRVRLSPETLELLRRHPWPGNVRELRNAMEHALAVTAHSVLLPRDLPRTLREADGLVDGMDSVLEDWLADQLSAGATYQMILDGLEAKVLAKLLKRYDGKPTILARELRINRVTLRKRCRDLLSTPLDPDLPELDS
jgi:DNA-binding NtrC family response regulator